jgi:hypothetical protein
LGGSARLRLLSGLLWRVALTGRLPLWEVASSYFLGEFSMRLFKSFIVMLAAVCALGALMAASAFALPTVLAETAQKYTGKSIGKTELQQQGGLVSVECASATGEGEGEAKSPLGPYHITFKTCKALGAECTGEGDEKGQILNLGTSHLVYDTLGATLGAAGVAILFLPGASKFNCGALVGTIETAAGGMVLCLIKNPTLLTKIFTFKCEASGTVGVPKETMYYNDSGTLVKIATLLSQRNTNGFVQSAWVGESTVEYTNDILIMI